MTTQIIFYNQTTINFSLKDADGNLFGVIGALSSYSLRLNYSDTFQKKYILTGLLTTGVGQPQEGLTLTFFLSINGDIASVQGPNQVFLQIGLPGIPSLQAIVPFLSRIQPLHNILSIMPPSPNLTSNQNTPILFSSVRPL